MEAVTVLILLVCLVLALIFTPLRNVVSFFVRCIHNLKYPLPRAQLPRSPKVISEHLKLISKRETEIGVVDGSEKIIIWNKKKTNQNDNSNNSQPEQESISSSSQPLSHPKTKYSVVYVHGWSSCRQDVSPLPELVAEKLGAHLFCGRLSGHGHLNKEEEKGSSLVSCATVDNLFEDALEAFDIGRKIGEKVILMGFSTGAALITWLAAQPQFAPYIAAIVLVSPAYALSNPQYSALKWSNAILKMIPFGIGTMARKMLVKSVIGEQIQIKITDPHKEARKYWTWLYPASAILHLADVLWVVDNIDFESIDVPVMIIANPVDNKVCYQEIKKRYEEFGSQHKSFKVISYSPDVHVCVGRIFSSMNVDDCVSDVLKFLQKANITA
eukprot:c13975_g1_i1.p1 GENE.c13975_g1_i1~~c13975_g1_i1.p1  ORF type:complete len:384 (-),score=146.67 c13975_g1_i1:26-1177(-)